MTEKYDVIVIGGGPAGMLAAGQAGALGARVLLLEKNDRLGKKLLLTGGGRCNITSAETDLKQFIARLGKTGRFFYSALSRFDCQDTLEFFTSRGLLIKAEGNKIFPASDKASDVLDILINYLKESNVTICSRSKVENLISSDHRIIQIQCAGQLYTAASVIVATGGLSYPATGSSGDGYTWASQLGHLIESPRPALMPLLTEENWVPELQGLSLENIGITIFAGNKKASQSTGDLMFTHYGLVSPEILNISEQVGLLLQTGQVHLMVDLFPQDSSEQLEEKIMTLIKDNSNKDLKNTFSALLPPKLLNIILSLVGIVDINQKTHSFTKDTRKKLCHLFKNLKIEIASVAGYEKAIITAGGVALTHIEPQTMRSKLFNNLYFAGEILDLQGPTGGYNLQIAWSTGYLAGNSAASLALT